MPAPPAISHNTDHVAQGLAHITTQFQEKPRYAALLTSWLVQCQEIEDFFWDLLCLRVLDNPLTGGAQFDVIGRIVEQAREGMDDATYVRFLRARVRANSSDARIETLLEIVALIQNDPTTPVRMREYYPKAVELETDNVIVSAWIVYNEFLRLAKDPGTGLSFIYSKAPAAGTLKLTSRNSALSMTTTQRMGSSWTIGTGGGVFAGEFGGETA